MEKINKILLVLVLFFTFNTKLEAQDHYVFNDTNYVGLKEVDVTDFLSFSYKLDFYDSLPNGNWSNYSVNDTLKRNWKQSVLIEGQFKDSLREGKFTYYYDNKKKKNTIQLILNYSKGLLHGEYIYYTMTGTIYSKGYYSHGVKDGFFIEYDPNRLDGAIRVLEYYEKGILKEWVKYKSNGQVSSQGIGETIKE